MNKNLTYLVLTPYFPSKKCFVGSYIFDQVNEIRKQTNFNIQIVKIGSLFSYAKDYTFKGFRVSIFKPIDFPFFIFPGLFNWINKIRFKYFLQNKKILNVSFAHSHVSYPAGYLVENLECRKIMQHHGLDVLQLMNGRSRFLRFIQKSFLIRNSIKHLNQFNINIGVSALVLQQLRKYKAYNPEKEYVLYNGVDREKFYKKVSISNEVFTIGCIGNFWEIKNQMVLIKSVQEILKSGNIIKLRLVGSGPTLKSCKKYVVEHNLSNYVFFENEFAHEDLNNFYNEIDLFVMPSHYEAFGCVYLESWAAEIPFIAIEGQGISEIIPDNKKMLAKRNNPNDIANKILFFMQNKYKLPSVKDFDIKHTIRNFLLLDIFK